MYLINKQPSATPTMTSMATATATLTTALPPSVGGFRALSSTQSNGLGCPRCGFDQLLHDDAAAQHRIAELETQIRRLNEKAMTTGMCCLG
jgi:50S ribosomal subunit-associated GTPase HflX